MNSMERFGLAVILRPFVLLLLGVIVLIPARLAVMRYVPEGKIKRLLLRRVN